MVNSRNAKRSRVPKRRKYLSSKKHPTKKRKPKPRTRRIHKRGSMQKLRDIATKVDDRVAKLSGKTDPSTDTREFDYEFGDITKSLARKVSGKIQKKLVKKDYHEILFEAINNIRAGRSQRTLPYNKKAKDVLSIFTPIECNFFTMCLKAGPNGGTENPKLSNEQRLHLMELMGVEMMEDYDVPNDKRYLLFREKLQFFLRNMSPEKLNRFYRE